MMWNYEGRKWTFDELHQRPDCLVTRYELKVNLVKRKKPVEQALKEKLDTTKATRNHLYFFHGLNLTLNQIVELKQCEVSYWKLCKNLRDGYDIEEAIKKEPTPIIKKIKKHVKTELKSVLKEIGSPYSSAQGSQVKILDQEIPKYQPELSWDYIAAKKLNRLLEARRDEVTLAKQLNEEDCTQRTK